MKIDFPKAKAASSADFARRLTRLYLLALGSVAIMVLGEQAVIQHFLERQAADSHLINVAGRQRMLSQQLVKAALATRSADDEPSRRRALAEVSAVVQTWEDTHGNLRRADPRLTSPRPNSPEITTLFATIEPAFRKMVIAARDLTTATTPDIEAAALRVLQAEEAVFLDGMDRLVTRYEAAAVARVVNLQRIEIGSTLLILAVLAAEGWFIFRPAVTRLREKIGDLLTAQAELSATVAQLEQTQETMRRHGQQLRQAQKMETIGQFAGGIAHNFNNLLTVIMGYSGLLLQRLTEENPSRKAVEHIHRATKRGSNLVQQLLSFSRSSEVQPVVLNINDRINTLLALLERILGDTVTVEIDPDATLWNTCVDPHQLEEALLNLAANARDAMPEGGTLVFRTRNVTSVPDVPVAPRRRYLAQSSAEESLPPRDEPRQFVLLTIQDTGNGMPPQVLDRLFEPFFTTKPVDKGTGLGLPTVLGVVSQAGGFVEVESVPEVGTTFFLYLPRAKKAAGHYSITGTFKPMSLTVEEKPGKVLVVEDEADVRGMVCEVLTEAGYTVLEAANGNEALEVFRRNRDDISLVLSDLLMPGMGGRALRQHLLATHPNLRFLIMSGRLDTPKSSETVDQSPILEKPFLPSTLLDRVKDVLAA